eukprot:24467_1
MSDMSWLLFVFFCAGFGYYMVIYRNYQSSPEPRSVDADGDSGATSHSDSCKSKINWDTQNIMVCTVKPASAHKNITLSFLVSSPTTVVHNDIEDLRNQLCLYLRFQSREHAAHFMQLSTLKFTMKLPIKTIHPDQDVKDTRSFPIIKYTEPETNAVASHPQNTMIQYHFDHDKKVKKVKKRNKQMKQDEAILINVDIDGHIKDTLVIHSLYAKDQKMKQILNKITNHLNQKYDPVKYEIYCIKSESYSTGKRKINITDLENESITEYGINEIKNKGLSVKVRVKYIHKVSNTTISCPEMKRLQSHDAMKCTVYREMKDSYKYCAENLYHLEQYTHFTDEYGAKTICKYKDQCKSYKRLENGGNALKDKCHMKMYRHPPRKRNLKLQQNVNAFIMNKDQTENHDVYEPTDDDKQRYSWNASDGYLSGLMEEVIVNGFGSDLCLECGINDECKHGDDRSILRVLDQKMNDHRHKQMDKPLNRGQMLALILYTGCECNYDLCASQRDGDYNKWKWFDYCLWWAIRTLSQREC